MPKYKKIIRTFEAEKLTEAQEIQTLEGTASAEAGDWILTGTKGEQWPVKDKKFKANYEPIGDGKYQTKPVEIEAMRMGLPFTIEASWGSLSGKPGDWIASVAENDQYPIDAEVFADTYEPA